MNKAWQEGAALFADGQWWEAHEAWEGPWRQATGQDRSCLSALILLAAALHKRWHHGSLTHRNFIKAERHLNGLPDQYAGIDLARLRAEVWSALQHGGGAARPRIALVGDPETARMAGRPEHP